MKLHRAAWAGLELQPMLRSDRNARAGNASSEQAAAANPASEPT